MNTFPSYIISLETSTRLATMLPRFQSVSWDNLELTPGVLVPEAQADRLEYVQDWFRKNHLPFLPKSINLASGSLGCLLAHASCYLKFLKTEMPRCFIFEDDFEFTVNSEFLKVLNWQKLFSECDLLFLHEVDWEFIEKDWIPSAHAYSLNRKSAILFLLTMHIWIELGIPLDISWLHYEQIQYRFLQSFIGHGICKAEENSVSERLELQKRLDGQEKDQLVAMEDDPEVLNQSFGCLLNTACPYSLDDERAWEWLWVNKMTHLI